MTMTSTPLLTGELTIHPWADRVVDTVGHDPRSPYVERFWLPVLGPSTVWLLRRITDELDVQHEGFVMALEETAKSIGLTGSLSRNGPFIGALSRLMQFGMARHTPAALEVRRRVPYLPARHLERLPQRLRDDHQGWVDREDNITAKAQRRRAFSLALTLMRLGENPNEIAWQLREWRFGDAVALEAIDWAKARCDAENTQAS
jgi:hypothetical protein